MSLSPTTAAVAASRIIGHRRGHSSGIDIIVSDGGEVQEKEVRQSLLEYHFEDDERGEDERREGLTRRGGGRGTTVWVVAWVVSLIVTSFVTYLLSRPRAEAEALGSFEKGFRSELRAAHSSISVHHTPFTGSLDFAGHHGFIPPSSPSLAYIGSGPAIDEAWETLTADRYFLLSDAEALEAYGSDELPKFWNVHHGGYVAGLDVLHSLHCLNHLRMSLYPGVYAQDPVDGPMHKAHCIDHLRQLLMCNVDLTPVPTQYFEGLQRNYINSSRTHTCRDFGQVRKWATERFNGSTAVKARNRDGTLRSSFYAPWGE